MNYGNVPPTVPLEQIRDEALFNQTRQLAALTLQQVGRPSLIYRGNTADYDLLTEEAVKISQSADAPEATFEAWRADIEEDVYITTQDDDPATSQEIITDAHSARLEGGHMPQLRDVKTAVREGGAAGEHTVQTLRLWQDTHSMSSLALLMSVTHGRDYDQQELSKVVSLSLVRGYGPRGDVEFSQHYYIRRDGQTGLLWAGSDAAGISGRSEMALADAGAFLQECSQPQPNLPVNRMLTPQEWMQLVTTPLNPADKVRL